MSSLATNEILDSIFEKEDLIEGFKIIWFVINNTFVNFEISGGSCNLSENTMRLKKEFEKCIISYRLIADINFLAVLLNSFILQGRLGTRLCAHSIS